MLNVSSWRWIAVLLCLACVQASQAESRAYRKLPDWVKTVVETPVGTYDSDVDRVELLDTSHVSIDSRGKKLETTRFAFKAVTMDARGNGYPTVHYNSDTDKVLSFEAWVITPDKEVISYGKKEVVDRSTLDSSMVVTSGRYQQINASGDIAPGAILVYESVVQAGSVFGSYGWFFQGSQPRLLSRISFDLPEGWKVEAVPFNMGERPWVKAENAWSWEMRDVPPITRQALAPKGKSLLAWGAFTVFPTSDDRAELRSFRSWGEMARYYDFSVYQQQRRMSDELRSKIQELAQGKTSAWERFVPLARFARNINYTHISLEIGKGSGSQPRHPAEVFETNWGDCKDKANFLCAALQEVGIAAYPLIVRSDERSQVFPEWAGDQFNHCIVAVEADESFVDSATVEHPELGRLLIFDPTDHFTAIGDLPKLLHGGKGLLLAGESGGLIELPRVTGERNLRQRRILAEVLPDGGLVGKYQESSVGQMAWDLRWRSQRGRSSKEFSDFLVERLSNDVPLIRITDPELEDDLDEGPLQVRFDFGSTSYGKAIGGALIAFKPLVIGRHHRMYFLPDEGEERTQPIILDPYHDDDSVEIYLPPGFRVGELPEPLELEESFARYAISFEVDGDMLRVRRQVLVRPDPVPAAEYQTLKSFFEKVIDIEQKPVVLERI